MRFNPIALTRRRDSLSVQAQLQENTWVSCLVQKGWLSNSEIENFSNDS